MLRKYHGLIILSNRLFFHYKFGKFDKILCMPRIGIYLFCIQLFITSLLFANVSNDTLTKRPREFEYQFSYRNMIIPSTLILYGVVGTYNKPFRKLNLNIKNNVLKNIGRTYIADDYLRYAPIVSVYFLDFIGVKAKHKFVDRSVIILSSYILTTATVRVLKNLTHIQRPDSSSFTSFPSGHTSLVFAGAEFMWQEYKDRSVWYGIAGYTIAGTVGVMRIVNNKHWLTDVAAGAGIGILSTKVAYIIHERIKHKVKIKKEVDALITPYYNQNSWGVGLAVRF